MSTTVSRNEASRARYDVVVLSGSAGGLQAMCSVLRPLPETFPVPIIAVLHHAVGRSPMVVKILQRSTKLRVVEAVDGEAIQPGHVYLAPADRHVQITPGRRLASRDARRINSLRSSVEPLLDSITEVYGPHAVSVILSGSGRNGAVSAKSLHDRGGIVIAQNRATAQSYGMPGAAIAIGAADHVLGVDEIAPALTALTRRGD